MNIGNYEKMNLNFLDFEIRFEFFTPTISRFLNFLLHMFLQDKQVCSYCTDSKADTKDMTLMKTCSFKAGSCNEVINLGKDVFRYGRNTQFWQFLLTVVVT